MSKPYSEDLRKRAVAAVEGGLSRRQAAGVFDVGISTVIRWVALPRDGQHCGKADGRGSSLPTDRGAGLDSRTR